MGRYADQNNIITTDQENLVTNAAIFKAILTRYGNGVSREETETILNADLDLLKKGDCPEAVKKALAKFTNPFILESFKYLLVGGERFKAISRDEMHWLLKELAAVENAAEETPTMANLAKRKMETLKSLRKFKQTGALSEISLSGTTTINREKIRNLMQGSDNERVHSSQRKKTTILSRPGNGIETFPSELWGRRRGR